MIVVCIKGNNYCFPGDQSVTGLLSPRIFFFFSEGGFIDLRLLLRRLRRRFLNDAQIRDMTMSYRKTQPYRVHPRAGQGRGFCPKPYPKVTLVVLFRCSEGFFAGY